MFTILHYDTTNDEYTVYLKGDRYVLEDLILSVDPSNTNMTYTYEIGVFE